MSKIRKVFTMDANNKNWAANVASNMPLDQLLAQLAQASPATTRPMPILSLIHISEPTRRS